MAPFDMAEIQTQLQPFLTELLRLANFEVRFQIQRAVEELPDATSPEILVNFSGPDVDLLLQRGGELLAALEHVAVKFLRLDTDERAKIAFDCGDYRSLRLEELRLTAETAAERVQRTGQPFALNPMDARERRVIHLALRDNPAIRTESQGAGPYRKVVILPAQSK